MARRYDKIDLPPHLARTYLEPGPIVLITSALEGETNVMTLGWHLVMAFTPSLIGCMISAGNHSFDLIRKSRQCVVNVPTLDLIDSVVAIGNTSGRDGDKFAACGLTADPATRVEAPLIRECPVNLECRLVDDALVDRYNFFVFEIVKGHAARVPRHPRTIHYTGGGVFMVAGKIVSRRGDFRPAMLEDGS